MIVIHFLVMAVAALIDAIFQAELRPHKRHSVTIRIKGDGIGKK